MHAPHRVAVLLLALLAASVARAHAVTVDGNPVEWSTRQPATDNLGMVVRNAGGAGELVWRDAAADTRTDLASPEVIADLYAFQVTGDAGGLYFLVRRQPGGSFVGLPLQVQIAIDLDRVAGSGQEFFAGFADTKVADGARWEFLVQTLFGSAGQAQVFDASWSKVADAAAVQGASGVVEIGLTWAALGLAAPPTAPLRLTIATFRAQANDLTVDIGGTNVSNVLDAVTDYGDPIASAFPITWLDVQDQVIDYSLEVWFAATGEVYAPLLVDRFVANAANVVGSSGEWIAVRNVSPISIPLGAYKIGDEETVDSTESMMWFPGTTLASGSTFTVGALPFRFLEFYGRLPDGGWDPPVANMSVFSPWLGPGAFIGLENPGDEILLLGPTNTILDVVAYGSGAYPGIPTFTPAPILYDLVERRGTQDTDDASADFVNAGRQCATDSQCGACRICQGGACVIGPNGQTCDLDSNLCTQDACVSGSCNAGSMLTCDDGKVCTIDSCVPATGLCQFSAKADATPCPDADLCDGTEICSAGNCVENSPLVCSDSNPCTADSCVPATGCTYTPTPGTACDLDSNLCTADSCDAGGSCVTGGALPCDDANPCTDDSCNPATGCLFQDDDANACSDSNTCTSGDHCVGGACQSAPVSCTDGNPCTADSCDPASGCSFQPLATGISCADGSVCNGDESCDGAGLCRPGTALDCDDTNGCTADTCDAAAGCAHAALTGTPCADGNLCNGDEACDPAGACSPGTPLSCDDVDACTAESCDPATGCSHTPIGCDDGSACTADACDPGTGCTHAPVSCDDANACTADLCDPATGCAHAPVSCDDGNPCTADACSPATGCSHTPTPGVACGDGNACNGGELCDGSGSCAPGTPPSCADGNPCTADSCDPATGCRFTPVAAGSSCANGDACDGDEACDAAGSCLDGPALNCDDSNGCTTDTCDAATGCAHAPLTGASCADGDLCNGDETCSAAGACSPSAPLACDDADACTAESCDPVTGCAYTPIGCDDGSACTADACDPGMGCTHAPVSCDDANDCTADLCDPATGCASTPVADGAACASGTCGSATCQAGTCACAPGEEEPSDPGGCGCGQRGAGGPAALLALLGSVALRPGRRRQGTAR